MARRLVAERDDHAAALTLRVTTSGLATGTYTANVQITATGATPRRFPCRWS